MSKWVSTWGQSHTDISHMSPDYKGKTMRLAVKNNLTGQQIRLRVSNLEGKKPVTIVQAAVQNGGGTQADVRFQGKAQQVLLPGEELYSDSVSLEVHPKDLIVISMAFEGPVRSGNGIVECVQCSKTGNFVKHPQFTTLHRSKTACYHDMPQAIPVLSSVEVLTEEEAGAIICFGDSITQQSKWTLPLLDAAISKQPGKVSVINKGIGGNRLLFGPLMSVMAMYGRAGIERFERDVLEEAGAKAMIIAMGTNDLAMARNPQKPDWVTAEMLEKTMQNLVTKCHERGILAYGTTILPRDGSPAYLKEAETERQRFNEWMRTSSCFDDVYDFDAEVRDAEHPSMLAFAYDSGDHLHPHALGGERMAKLIADKLWGSV